MLRDGLAIIESKSKVRYSRSRASDSRVSTDAPLSTSNNSFDIQQIAVSLEDKMTIKMKQMMNEMKALVVTTPINDLGNTNQALSSSTLPSNTVPNPRNEAKAITTRSGVSYEGPSIPMPHLFVNPDAVEETSTDPVPPPLTQKVQETNSQTITKVNQEGYVNCPKTYELKLPYPERRNVEKRQDKDKVQLQKFWKMFKQLHFNISLADALILMPKYTKMLKDLCANKEKLEELANTPLSENCSAVILKKLHEKLGDSCRFTIPCDFSKLKCQGLADLGASINLMPLSVFHGLGFTNLESTQMTLELANHQLCRPDGICKDVLVPVGNSSPIEETRDLFSRELSTDEFTLPNSLPPGDDVSILKKDFQEENISNYLKISFRIRVKSSQILQLESASLKKIIGMDLSISQEISQKADTRTVE
ncbi:reverse transcriptase domain-containing protein [Tanacetum coccineum]|uniref:Reverse transcriptase domain-containing protein n=1 Tax=Tanacetum coccineum TaxID=301880 RepID=A0ABQ4Z4E6_9ASTR